MQTVLAALKKKNLLDDQYFYLLENLSTFNQHLLKRQIGMSKRLPKCRKYSPELRSFALTLHYYSPRAYKFVRSKFDTCLPHTKTICKWYKSIHIERDFIQNHLNQSKNVRNDLTYLLR